MGIGRYRSFQWFLRRIWRVTCDLQVIGREHLVEKGPLIIASNHASFFDPMLLGCAYDRPLSFMARQSLFENRKFSWFIRSLYAFPLARGADSKKALRMFEERLKKNLAVVLFPEGTRSADGHYVKSESAVGMLSTRSGAPVQPVYLMGTWHAWPRQRPGFGFRPLRAYVAPAIYPRPGLGRGEKRAEQGRIDREYNDAILEMERRAWAEYPAGATPRCPPELLPASAGGTADATAAPAQPS